MGQELNKSDLNLNDFLNAIDLCAEGKESVERVLRQTPELLNLPLNDKLFDIAQYQEGLKEMQSLLGEDENGLKQFVYMCRCAIKTYGFYAERGIHSSVYWATMRFLSRFIKEDYQKSGQVIFRWGWWFPRQLSMQEFRLGALEFEMTNANGNNEIYLHIPSDADFSEESVTESIQKAKSFFAKYFPRYANAKMYCDSWLLAPTLKELLPQKSNILNFQKRFEIIRVDEKSNAFAEWIYPGLNVPPESLPETTSLQKSVKKHLLSGGTIGWTLGKLKSDF